MGGAGHSAEGQGKSSRAESSGKDSFESLKGMRNLEFLIRKMTFEFLAKRLWRLYSEWPQICRSIWEEPMSLLVRLPKTHHRPRRFFWHRNWQRAWPRARHALSTARGNSSAAATRAPLTHKPSLSSNSSRLVATGEPGSPGAFPGLQGSPLSWPVQ